VGHDRLIQKLLQVSQDIIDRFGLTHRHNIRLMEWK
jgi:hypothetical protein